MNSNTKNLLSIREASFGIISNETTVEERFQNTTLRPILKLQNEKFVFLFKKYLEKYSISLEKLNTQEKMKLIENGVKKDKQMEQLFKGIVIGMFTIEELEQYYQNPVSYNKRIIAMLVERLQSQIQLFE